MSYGVPSALRRRHAVQHQAMQVHVEDGRRAKALDQRDAAAVGFVGLEPSLAAQVACDQAVHHLQPQSHQLVLCGQLQAQRDRQSYDLNEQPPAHRRTGHRVRAFARAWSNKCAAVRAMHRAAHERHKPRRLQLNATSLSCPQSPQRNRRKPWAGMPHLRKASKSALGVLRQIGVVWSPDRTRRWCLLTWP